MKKLVEFAEVAPASLRAHPRNYRSHPADQIAHIVESLTAHGVYRNVVIANDDTILAGHGVVKAAIEAGLDLIPVRRLDIAPDDPRALKILTGDNEISGLSEQDDRQLADLLKEVFASDVASGLLGTGFDDKMLANLVFVTRPAGEIRDLNAAAEWVGMPEFEPEEERIRLILCFTSDDEKSRMIEDLGVTITKRTGQTSTAWYPPRPRDDLVSSKLVVDTDV